MIGESFNEQFIDREIGTRRNSFPILMLRLPEFGTSLRSDLISNEEIEVEILKNTEIQDDLDIFVPYRHILDHPIATHERSREPLKLSVSQSMNFTAKKG